MKIRTSFVTNSSSSSYITIYKIKTKDIDRLFDYAKVYNGLKGIELLLCHVHKAENGTISFESNFLTDEIFNHIDDYNLYDRECCDY